MRASAANDAQLGLLANRAGEGARSYSGIDEEGEVDAPSSRASLLDRLSSAAQAFRTYLDWNPVVISSVGLVVATAMERVTFKVMIDRMLPYKFVLIEIIFALACTLFTSVTIFILYSSNQISVEMRQFPQKQLFLMAVLDTAQFILLVYSGAGVSPTMTVILMHASTIFVVLGSKVVFPNRRYGWAHNAGLLLMGGAVALSVLKILWYDSTENEDYFATYSSLVYVGAACLQGLSTLYKEQALAAWSRPINLYYLSAYLFFYQFFVTIAFSAVFYGLFSDANMFHSFYYGWMCFLGDTPAVINRDDDITVYVNCSASLWVILGYVLSTFCVLVCLHSVLESNAHSVPRLLSAAICAAFLLLWAYDAYYLQLQPSPYIFGGSVGAVDVVALVLLLLGTEIYGRDPEPDVELITHYPTPGSQRAAAVPAVNIATGSEFVPLTRDNKAVRP